MYSDLHPNSNLDIDDIKGNHEKGKIMFAVTMLNRLILLLVPSRRASFSNINPIKSFLIITSVCVTSLACYLFLMCIVGFKFVRFIYRRITCLNKRPLH